MRVLKTSQINLKELANIIRKGQIIICPTDTVYGILSDATNKKTVERVFKIKKRSAQKFLPIFVKNLKTAKKLAKINKNQEKFLKSVWPGKTTAVLKRNSGIKIFGVKKKHYCLKNSKLQIH